MAINYNVQAEVVDLKSDYPKADDVFLVDTQVWYWMTYQRASQSDQPPELYQIHDYPTYIARAKKAGAALHRCELSLAELAHLIERVELELYSGAEGYDKITRKEFRHNHPAERSSVVSEIEAAWGLVKNIAPQSVRVNIDESLGNAVLARCATQPLDGYDLIFVEAITRSGIVQVITDDGDFATVPGIVVFTSNKNVINRSRRSEKLLSR